MNVAHIARTDLTKASSRELPIELHESSSIPGFMRPTSPSGKGSELHDCRTTAEVPRLSMTFTSLLPARLHPLSRNHGCQRTMPALLTADHGCSFSFDISHTNSQSILNIDSAQSAAIRFSTACDADYRSVKNHNVGCRLELCGTQPGSVRCA